MRARCGGPVVMMLFLVMLLIPAGVSWGWGSMDRLVGGGAFGTHQFLCREAYKRIENHPALPYVGFPSLDAIIDYSSVSLWQSGNGPDNPEHSTYSEHWYNPLTKTGDAPASVERYYKGLRKVLQEYTLLGEDSTTPENPAAARAAARQTSREQLALQAAENAAYAAHYIQDMTCPFHLVGMPKTADRSRPAGKDITGPYRDYVKDPALWQRSVAASNTDNAAGSNWFDPNYYDGSGDMPNKSSSHVLYEILVETNYQRDKDNTRLAGALKKDQVSAYWDKGADIKAFTQRIALDVRRRLDNRDADMFFDINPIHERIRAAQESLRDPAWQRANSLEASYEYISKTVAEFVGAGFLSKVPVPYRQWAQAIQATYFLWRGSFCALMIKKDDIRIVKVPNARDLFTVAVRIANLEPDEDATDVGVTFKYKENGTNRDGGSARVASIKAGTTTEWLELAPAFRVTDLNAISAFRFAVKGSYAATPDAGMTVIQYERTELASDAFKLHNVVDKECNQAVTQLKTQSNRLNVSYRYGQPAPIREKEFCVISQEPGAGTWVSPTDTVILEIFNRFSTVTFKGTVRDLMSNKKISGANIQVMVNGFSGSTVSGHDGKFEFNLEMNPQIMDQRPPAKVTVNCPGYAPYQMMLTLFDTWRIELRPDIKPEFEARISEQRIDYSPTCMYWEYQLTLLAKKVGVHFTKFDVRQNTMYPESFDNDCDVRLNADKPNTVRMRTGGFGITEPGAPEDVVQEVTFRGMDDNGAPAQFSFRFRADKKMVDSQRQNDAINIQHLVTQYLVTYRDNTVPFRLDTFEALIPIEQAHKGNDTLVFVKALCAELKPKFFVSEMRQFDYDALNKIMSLVQFYIMKTMQTRDPRYEQEAAYIMRFLVPVKKFYGARCPAWQGQTGAYAQQLVPEFFGNYY